MRDIYIDRHRVEDLDVDRGQREDYLRRNRSKNDGTFHRFGWICRPIHERVEKVYHERRRRFQQFKSLIQLQRKKTKSAAPPYGCMGFL
jgi:hypothetical protein